MLKPRSPFTLTHSLVVITVIGVLVWIVWPLSRAFMSFARRAEAQATLKALAQQIEGYKLQEGSYPPSKGGSAGDPSALVIYLGGIQENGGPSTPYFDFRRSEVDNQNRFLDPWGGFYYYRNLT